MKTIAIFASFAAVMTSSSRIEPPGWAIAVIPPFAAISMLSANGMKASEAREDPSDLSHAIRSARCTLTTLLGWPAPMPTKVLSFPKTIVLDLI